LPPATVAGTLPPDRMPRTTALTLSAVYVAAALLAAGAAEIQLRRNDGGDRCLAGPRPEDLSLPPAAYARVDRELGWVSAPVGDEVNAAGFRDPRAFDAATAAGARPRVVVLGDSFMWGAGVDADQTVPRQLERALGDETAVFNVSVPGWGLDQMYLAWLRYRDVLRPDVVVVAFIDDDVDRVLMTYRQRERLTKPAFRLDGDRLVLRGTDPPPGTIAAALSSSVVARCFGLTLERATTARSLARRILGILAEDAAARGARVVVLRIPDGEVVGSAVRRRWWTLRGFPDAAPGAAYVEPLVELETLQRAGKTPYVADGHLSADGSAAVAARLAALLAS
jgi:hypothetical protein